MPHQFPLIHTTVERQSKSMRSTCGYREESPSFLVLQRGSLCHRRCTVRLQKETISIMPYCSVQMHGQFPGLLPTVLPAKLCQGLDTRGFVGRPFCLSCMCLLPPQTIIASSSAVSQCRGNMKHQVHFERLACCGHTLRRGASDARCGA